MSMSHLVHGCIILCLEPEKFPQDRLTELHRIQVFTEIILFRAIRPEERGCPPTRGAECDVHNRHISCLEAAISASHHAARVAASRFNWNSTTFLEADFCLDVGLAVKYLEFQLRWIVSLEKPAGFHFFGEQGGVLQQSGQGDILRVLWLPDYAVAYALNRLALVQSLQQLGPSDASVADWPEEIRRFSWWSSKRPIFSHPDPGQSISVNHMNRIARKRNFSDLRKLLLRQYYIQLFLRLFVLAPHFRLGTSPIESQQLRSVMLPNAPVGLFKRKGSS